jgi:hypothetical protein
MVILQDYHLLLGKEHISIGKTTAANYPREKQAKMV